MSTCAQPRTPDVSVVVASFSGRDGLGRCLASLLPAQRVWGGDEVVVATTLAAADVTALRERFPGVRFLQGPEGADVFRLRTLGLEAARGRIVALTEDHCTFSPGWPGKLAQALGSGLAAAGGPVENGLDDSTYDQALYLCEYGAFMPPLPRRGAPLPSGINVAYPREALLRCRPVWQGGFYENEVHDALRAAGGSFGLVGGARVFSHLTMSLREAMAHLFAGGRRFGGYRASRRPWPWRGAWAVAALVVPLLLLRRLVCRLAGRRPERLGALVRGLPWVLCLYAAWSAGEAIGPLWPAAQGISCRED
jgi:hypothetical protein